MTVSLHPEKIGRRSEAEGITGKTQQKAQTRSEKERAHLRNLQQLRAAAAKSLAGDTPHSQLTGSWPTITIYHHKSTSA